MTKDPPPAPPVAAAPRTGLLAPLGLLLLGLAFFLPQTRGFASSLAGRIITGEYYLLAIYLPYLVLITILPLCLLLWFVRQPPLRRKLLLAACFLCLLTLAGGGVWIWSSLRTWGTIMEPLLYFFPASLLVGGWLLWFARKPTHRRTQFVVAGLFGLLLLAYVGFCCFRSWREGHFDAEALYGLGVYLFILCSVGLLPLAALLVLLAACRLELSQKLPACLAITGGWFLSYNLSLPICNCGYGESGIIVAVAGSLLLLAGGLREFRRAADKTG